ncbi:Predicted PurR-regulated permease PerM [Rhodospirillales bacterium URHD0017]|nr:Predicted PurR-regulated permease PerM [Rhodospirillales bacterium URHD0017]
MIETEKGRAELSRFTIDLAIRIALIAGVVWLSLALLRPIMPLLVWAVILAVAVHPVFAALRRRLRLPRGLAATVVSLVLLVLLFVPVVMLAVSAVGTLEGYAGFLAEGGHLLPAPPESIREWPLIGQRLYDLWTHANEDVRPLLTGHVAQIASVGRSIGGIAAGVTLEILQFAAAIIVAGVLLVYAETLTGGVRDLADRVADARGRRFLDITGSTIRNVSQGVIGIALLQSALLGIGMLVAGVPFAGALTFACLVLAIVQVGPNIVMIPVIIWAWFSLPTLTAAVFTAYTAPLLLVDNVLRPIVMARGLQTPMVVILAGVICGTLAGGLIGLFIGPVVLAVFYELVTAWIMAGRHATEAP